MALRLRTEQSSGAPKIKARTRRGDGDVKAVVVRKFAPIESIEIAELPDPVPGKNQVVIDVKAAEVNYPDLLVISGRYQIKPPLPFAPGKAATGVVSAIGPGVAGLAVGDRV